MDRPTTPATERATAMRITGTAALDILLPATGGGRGEFAPAAKTRRVVSEVSVLWQSADGRHARRQSQTRPAADAHCWYRGHLPEAQPEPSGAVPRDLSIPAARRLDRPAQSRLEHRYYVHPHARR